MSEIPNDAELLERLMGKLLAQLAPLHGQEITAEMKAKVDAVITRYFEDLELMGHILPPYPRWRLVEMNDGIRIEFNQADMATWMATHPAPAAPKGTP